MTSNTFSSKDRKALYDAVQFCNFQLLDRMLTERFYPVNLPLNNEDGNCALHYACELGYLKVVEVLVEHGADVNLPAMPSGATPVICAASNGHQNVLMFLVIEGARVDHCDGVLRRNCLHWAACNGHYAVVRFIVENYYINREAKDRVSPT
jgi:ankyrin repeat protein